MRYQDARLVGERDSLWLKLKLLSLRLAPTKRQPAFGDLSGLSDHQLQDIGLTRREAETGRPRDWD